MRAHFARWIPAVVLLASLAGALAAPPGPATTRAYTFEVTECGARLCFNGQVPGPTLDVNVGDTLVVTVNNHLASNMSLHVHGMTLSAAMDGVAHHAGTQLADSSVPANGSFTYTMRASLRGVWHYHDHVLGLDGQEGANKGLYGAILVRNPGDLRPDAVFDAHLFDKKANTDQPFAKTVAVGSSFETAFVGLGNRTWDVVMKAPNGTAIGSVVMAPGLSDHIVVASADAGTYTWTATARVWGNKIVGTVVAQ